MSWYDVSICIAAIKDKRDEEELKQEFEWARTRSLWLPLMRAHFKKEGGGDYEPQDLIKLSFDKTSASDKPASLKEVKAMLGSRIKK